MKKDDLLSISPLDGRYSDVCKDIGDVFSEYSLIKHRVYVEIKWFIFLSKIDKIKGLPKLKPKDEKFLLDIYNDFSLSDARSVKKLESTTKHDVKAI
ncbi:MAG: adenylosuccinate lyase, partial [Gammaproteobacteria bacterium]|nr:adenylosuccinate lyase [Gammaproteobacteria bacterium]